MAFELSTVGAKVAYCVAATANTKPTTGYTVLEGLTEAPEIELSAESIEVTNLGDTAKRYIPGLKDRLGKVCFEKAKAVRFESNEYERFLHSGYSKSSVVLSAISFFSLSFIIV